MFNANVNPNANAVRGRDTKTSDKIFPDRKSSMQLASQKRQRTWPPLAKPLAKKKLKVIKLIESNLDPPN